MYREMRNQKRKLSEEKALGILEKGEYGILSTIDPEGFPYGVPLSYAYTDGNIYFHCALEGHKLDNIKNDSRVSFCVVQDVRLVPEKFTTKYESAIVFGRAAEVTGEEKNSAFMAILQKYSPQYMKQGIEYIAKDSSKARIIRIAPEHISGKASK